MKYPKIKIPENDWSAIADRLEWIFNVLTGDTVGAQTISVDYRMANRAIAYCRRMAAGRRREDLRPNGAWEEMIQFLYCHNQCLGWVLFGDPTGIILRLAENTTSRMPPRLSVV